MYKTCLRKRKLELSHLWFLIKNLGNDATSLCVFTALAVLEVRQIRPGAYMILYRASVGLNQTTFKYYLGRGALPRKK